MVVDGLIKTDCSNRPVIIHSQFLEEVDIKKIKNKTIIPSLFISHVYYYGDVHLKNVGQKARNISPAKTLSDNGIIYTIHQDTPVNKPDMLELVWCSVKRETKEGKIFEKERISVYEALKAITINAAYQYFEEDIKGSIKKGKIADFVILDKNPLLVDVDELKEIKVLNTIKYNKIIYVNNR